METDDKIQSEQTESRPIMNNGTGSDGELVSWLLPFKERVWFRFGAKISAVFVIVSLLLPLVGYGNYEALLFSLAGFIIFLLVWAKQSTGSISPGFLALGVILSFTLLYPLWLPWIDAGNPFSSLQNVIASLFVMIVTISLGVSVNWTLMYHLDDASGLQVFWLLGSLFLYGIVGGLMYLHVLQEGLNILNLVGSTYCLAGFCGSLAFLSSPLLSAFRY